MYGTLVRVSSLLPIQFTTRRYMRLFQWVPSVCVAATRGAAGTLPHASRRWGWVVTGREEAAAAVVGVVGALRVGEHHLVVSAEEPKQGLGSLERSAT